jgi:hypothetical protein
MLPCRDDVPAQVLEWMAANLAEHAAHEFDEDYEPDWGQGYVGPPLAGAVFVSVAALQDPLAAFRAHLQALTDRGFGPVGES